MALVHFPRTLDVIAAEKRTLGTSVRLRVESAGTFAQTRVVAVEEDGTEHPVRFVERVAITNDADGARAVITVPRVDVDVTATLHAGA